VPELRVEVVTDPVFLEAARAGKKEIDERRITQPSQLFSCPAHLLLRPEGFPKKSFVLYQHIFGPGGTYPDRGWFYVGITTRSWQKRWAEHRRAIESGSPLLFHRKFREELGAGAISNVNHKVMGVTDDIEMLYATKEFLVEGHWRDERRLNMVPGGKSAPRYMREHVLIAPSVVPMPDERAGSSLNGWKPIRGKACRYLGLPRNGATTTGRWRRSAAATTGCRSIRCVQSARWRRSTAPTSPSGSAQEMWRRSSASLTARPTPGFTEANTTAQVSLTFPSRHLRLARTTHPSLVQASMPATPRIAQSH